MEVNRIKETVSYLLARICHTHRNNVNESLSKLGLHVGQEMFLFCLWQGDGITQSELADQLSVQQATVTRMLNRMSKAGLVERRRDKQDQRISRVYLTTEGKMLQQPVLQLWGDVEAEILAPFSDEERMLLRQLLHQLYGNIAD